MFNYTCIEFVHLEGGSDSGSLGGGVVEAIKEHGDNK